MNRSFQFISTIVFGSALLFALGCGGGGSSGSGSSNGNGGGDNGGTTMFSATCCINGQNYSCPSQDAANACGNGDPSQCTSTSTSPDGMCH